MTAFDPEYAAQMRERARLASEWAAKRCNDPECTGCSPRRLTLCALVTSPPKPAPPPVAPVPAALPFVPASVPQFVAHVRALKHDHDRIHRNHTPERPRAGPDQE